MITFPLNSTAAVVDKTINNGFTWGDTMNVTLCGISIVFLMIVLLFVIIKVFGISMDKIQGVPKTKKVVKPAAKQQPKIVKTNKTANENDDEIIAVISAAVAALYDGSGTTPLIKSIKHNGKRIARNNWANAGVLENTKAF